MSDNQIPLVVVEEVKTGQYRVDLWSTPGPHLPTDKPFVSIHCSGFDTGKLPDTDGAAPITLWDSTGEVIARLNPRRAALRLAPCRSYVPMPYYDPSIQQSAQQPQLSYVAGGNVAAVMDKFDGLCRKLGNARIGDICQTR